VGGTSDPRSDADLIRDIREGDASAFDSLYFRWRDWVVALAYRFTLNHDDSLDVLQETFTYLVRKGEALELTASMKTFLYPVVRNLSLEIRRKRRRMTHDDAAIEAVPVPPSLSPSRESSELAQVLSQLPAAHREVLLMRFVDGLKIEEIAQALSIPPGTVKSRLHNGLEMLRSDPRTREYFDQ
jgi:RNA polymerase sigma-70 factor (ECF subfamily)